MMKDSDVFVISEDDILKPSSARKGKPSAGTLASLEGGDDEDRQGGADADQLTVAASSRRTAIGSGTVGPAIAATLSLWVWGLGQFFNGDRRLGTLFFLSQMQVAALHYMLYMVWGRLSRFAELFFISEWELLLYVGAVDFCVLVLMMFNVAHAYRTAEAGRGRFTGLHLPIVSGLASSLVPGWGQLLNGQLGKAILFLSAFFVQLYLAALYLLSPFFRVLLELDPQQIMLKQVIDAGTIGLFVTMQAWVISAYDAVIVARYTKK